MAFLTNLANSLIKNVLPEMAENLFPASKNIIDQYKQSKINVDRMFNNMSNDVRKSFTAFERDNPVFRNLSKQIKSGDFGMTDNLDNKMMGFDDSLGGDLDSNLEEFNFDFGGDSSSESPSPSNENLAISQGEGMIAGQLNYQTVVSKKSTIAQLGVMSEIAEIFVFLE
jgi:hypothetical protein